MISAAASPLGPLTTLLQRLDSDVTAIAVTAAVLFAAIAGVKFIASAGSPQRQAEARSSLAAAIVGLHDHAADDVGGHEVRCELDARVAQVEGAGERPQ